MSNKIEIDLLYFYLQSLDASIDMLDLVHKNVFTIEEVKKHIIKDFNRVLFVLEENGLIESAERIHGIIKENE